MKNLYIIKDQKFYLTDGVETLLKEINGFLNKQKIVITDENGNPIEEDIIISIILNYREYQFITKPVSVIENEFAEEVIQYVEKVNNNYPTLFQSMNKDIVINSFIELVNSILEIGKTAQYFELDFIPTNEVNELTNVALQRLELGDADYISDMVEYEIIPSLNDFKDKLKERLYH